MKFASLIILAMTGGPLAAQSEPGVPSVTHDQHRQPVQALMTTKPEAPIDIRWIDDGRDGHVALEIVSGVDHVGAVVRLIVPGQGEPRQVQLPAAKAGEAQRAQWWLERPPAHAPRVLVEIDTGESRMPRNSAAPWARGKDRSVRAEFEARGKDRETGREKTEAGSQADQPDSLVTLPAEQTIRPREQ